MTEAEYTRLLEVTGANVRDAAIIELFLQTGIRLSKLVNLSVRDVTLSSRDSCIRVKRGNGHVIISLNDKAQNALRRWLRVREVTSDTALFLSAFNKGISKRAVQVMLEKYLDAANIEGASVQSLRHTMAVHHIAKGTPPETLAEVLGDHPDTLEQYMTAARGVQQRALQEHML